MRTLLILGIGLIVSGCETLRFAPGEAQKQNAYLHEKTAARTAELARAEKTSPALQDLSGQSARQSEAQLVYFGLPRELPQVRQDADLTSPASQVLTQQAQLEAAQRPDPWAVADNLLQLGIGLAGVVGGVYGARAVQGLQAARTKSQALREIVAGNELFKQQNPDRADAFKEAQALQSDATRQLVAALK